ncbi:hypothetical protein PQX77_022287 [Marasmius sp. AFHP31]|nr:hypothetical protein PQX77_022287 [Marasmius sp. AFHP31]
MSIFDRCFPHIINIAIKTGLKHLTMGYDFATEAIDTEYEHPVCRALLANEAYHNALQGDVLATGQKIVTAVKASGQQRNELQDIIEEGNKAGIWGNIKILKLQSVKEMEVRWSSSHLMNEQLLVLYPAIEKFLLNHGDLSDLVLTPVLLQVLNDIHTFLSLPHALQEIVSAQKTPTLSVVILLYEQLISRLNNLIKLPLLEHAIWASIDKLKEYLMKARTKQIYVLAIALNLMTKFQWMKDHWSAEECDIARTTVAKMQVGRWAGFVGHKPRPITKTVSAPASTYAGHAQAAAWSQNAGMMKFAALRHSYSTVGSKNQDPQTVQPSMKKYEDAGIIDINDPEALDFNLLQYWQVNQHNFPLHWTAALGVLPAQASSVPFHGCSHDGNPSDSQVYLSL